MTGYVNPFIKLNNKQITISIELHCRLLFLVKIVPIDTNPFQQPIFFLKIIPLIDQQETHLYLMAYENLLQARLFCKSKLLQ